MGVEDTHTLSGGGTLPPGDYDLKLDSEIAGYRIKRKLGAGSMGTVYLAIQLSLDRPVAIKILNPNLAHNEEFARRFLQEAKTVAKLNHPNVISGIDVGEQDGIRYFVMELVSGLTIRAIVERGGPMDEGRVAHVALQVARALDHARQLNLVHRDVKPDNIIVTTDGVAKLCDLGLAKDRPDEGLSMGTPAYISPEQAKGQSEVDIRSDLYSLGASMYHMLAGKPPFDGTAQVVMTKHLNEIAVPLRQVDEDISGEMEATVTRLMEKQRVARFQTPAELVSALEAYQDKRRRRPMGASPVKRRPASRRRR